MTTFYNEIAKRRDMEKLAERKKLQENKENLEQ